jgi:hypothetical protein
MNNWEEEVIKKLGKLDSVPDRNPLKVQSHKQNFMKDVRMLNANLNQTSPKLSWWNQIFAKKEIFTMKVITIFAILGLLFGGGVTAVAAQDSLPGDFLYPVKTLVEDIELGLATDPDTQFLIANKHANKRFTEIQRLIEEGELPPEPFFFKWYEEVQTSLKFALATEDATGNLLLVQQQLQTQSQTMLMNKGDSTGQPIMNMFQNAFQNQSKLINAGIDQPDNLTNELEFMFQYQQQMGKEDSEEVWQNLYQKQTQMQNAGEESQIQYYWMFMGGEGSLEVPPQYGQSEESGSQNSFNDHPNGGNQGDNENGSNGGQGGNGGSGGSGGK